MNLDRPTPEALSAYDATEALLHMWADTVHNLVEERIRALLAAYPDYNHPTETAREYAERVLAHGQYPFPEGESIHSDLDNNRGYEHVHIIWNGDGKGVQYVGWYPEWAPDGNSYQWKFARISVPLWVLTDSDGETRYRVRTQEMVAYIKRRRIEEKAQVRALVDRILNEREPDTGPSTAH